MAGETRTERDLREHLLQADRLATVGRLAAGVAHELNEPLLAILGHAELVAESFGLPDQTTRDVDKIIKAALKAREIVKKLLIFSRQMVSEPRPVKLNSVIRDVLSLLEARCVKAGVKIVLRLSPDLPEMVADPAQLEQVVLNLTVNAIQAMPGGGKISVETRSVEGGVRLAVEDAGMGMTEDVRGRIFTPFFTTREVGQGTGLGLAVVHGIVTAHNGTISVASAPGKGTRFELFFPLEQPAGDG